MLMVQHDTHDGQQHAQGSGFKFEQPTATKMLMEQLTKLEMLTEQLTTAEVLTEQLAGTCAE